MAFIAIYTPRTASRRPAIVIPPTQRKLQSAIRQAMREAEAAVPREKGSSGEGAWKPISLSNALGASVPVRADTGARVYEIYLLCGVDTSQIDEETARSVQSRLATQIAATADNLITSGIPWAHRSEPAHRAQFSGADFVLRSELGSYAMMFTNLPEVAKFKAGIQRNKHRWVNWAAVLTVPLIGAFAYFLYTRSAEKRLASRDREKMEQSEVAEAPGPKMTTLRLPAPDSTPVATPPPAPKPIVMPDPFEHADLTELEKALIEIRTTRERLMQEKETAANTPESLMRWEKEAIRFNRRRQQLIRAFGRINTEAGQGALDPIFIEDFSVDLYTSPERMVKAREDLEKLRSELVDRREKIDTSNLPVVEDYNDSVDWFNFRAEAFNRAVERAKTWGQSSP